MSTPKKIGPWLATFVVANNMIGSGFFLLPASLATQGGVTALSWLVGMVIAIVLGAAFSRLARDYPTLDCPDDYVRPALGRDMGFLATTLYWVASWAGNNAIAVAAFGYLVTLLPMSGDDTGVRLTGQLVLIWAMFAINLLGPRPVARFQSFCLVLGLLPVAVVLVGGWGAFDTGIYADAWNVTEASDAAVVFTNLAPVFWAFVGLETGAMVAGIVDNPDRNVPIATMGGVLIAGVVYLLSSVLVMGIVPHAELAASSAPFALVAAAIFGPWAATIIAAAAALKATGTLGGWMQVTGEAGARAAERGYLPRWFARMLPNGAAHWGLLFVALAMTVIAFVTLAPTVAGQFGAIIGMVTLLIVLAYFAAGLALVVGTPEKPSGPREKLLGLVSLLACGVLIFSSPWSMIAGAAAVTLVSWILFRLAPHRYRVAPKSGLFLWLLVPQLVLCAAYWAFGIDPQGGETALQSAVLTFYSPVAYLVMIPASAFGWAGAGFMLTFTPLIGAFAYAWLIAKLAKATYDPGRGEKA